MTRTVIGYGVGALVLGAIAGVMMIASRIDRNVALAQQQIVTLELEAPELVYEELAESFRFAEVTPWLFGAMRSDLMVRRAALRYWRGEFAELVRDFGDTSATNVQDNLPLQFIVANAAYRAGMNAEVDQADVIRALDGAISAYFGVLQMSPDHLDAAYNYEYLIRLRADIEAGLEIERQSLNPNGQEGEFPQEGELDEIKIYVPVQRDVDPEMDESPTLGSGQSIRKRG